MNYKDKFSFGVLSLSIHRYKTTLVWFQKNIMTILHRPQATGIKQAEKEYRAAYTRRRELYQADVLE